MFKQFAFIIILFFPLIFFSGSSFSEEAETSIENVEAITNSVSTEEISTEEAVIEEEEEGEFTAFDLYVAGDYFGIVFGSFGEDWFRLNNPKDAITLIQNVKTPEAFLPLFKGKIMGSKQIDDLGTITLDVNNFKINIEVAKDQSLLTKAVSLADLSDKDKTFAIQNSLLATGSTSFADLPNVDNIAVTHDTLFSLGRSYFKSEGSLSSKAGYELTAAAVRHDLSVKKHDITAFAGMLQSKGLRFARSLDFYGVSAETNDSLLFRGPLLQASQIEIFIPKRAHVEIYRDSFVTGRVLFSQIIDFGTHQIDTRSFPMGSYDIEIAIKEIDGTYKVEKRPFSKSRSLPPLGKPAFNLEVGNVRNDLDTVSNFIALASYESRIKDWLGGKMAMVATDDDAVIEGELSAERQVKLFKKTLFVETGIFAGVDDELEMTGIGGELSITTEDQKRISVVANKTFDRNTDINDPTTLSLSARKFINVNASMNLSFFGLVSNLKIRGEWSHSEAEGSHHRIGPELNIQLFNKDNMSIDMGIELVDTDEDKRAMVSFKVAEIAGPWMASSQLIARIVGSESSVNNTSNVDFIGNSSKHEDWRKRTNANLKLGFSPLYSNEADRVVTVGGNINHRSKWAQVEGFVDADLVNSTGRVGGELSSTIIWTKDGPIKASPDNLSPDSALLSAKINGSTRTKIGLSVDGSPRVYGFPGETLYLTLPIYKTSKIKAFDAGEEGNAVAFKKDFYNITAFPGNVFYREFDVSKLIIVMGQLIDFNGNHMIETRIELDGEIFYTGEDGSFDLEVSYFGDKKLNIITSGQTCNIILPKIEKEQIIVEVGDVVCVKKAAN